MYEDDRGFDGIDKIVYTLTDLDIETKFVQSLPPKDDDRMIACSTSYECGPTSMMSGTGAHP